MAGSFDSREEVKRYDLKDDTSRNIRHQDAHTVEKKSNQSKIFERLLPPNRKVIDGVVYRPKCFQF